MPGPTWPAIAACSKSRPSSRDVLESAERTEQVAYGELLAAEADYNGGGEWLDQIRTIIRENDALLRNTLAEKAPGVVVTPLEGTYLAWADLGAYVKPEELERFVEGRCGLAVDYGSWFGGQAPCHIRINLATRPEIVRQAALALAENL